MTKTIHSYKLENETLTSVSLPLGAEIFSIIDVKNTGLYIYALVDKEQEMQKKRWFEVYSTGADITVSGRIFRKHLQSVCTGYGTVLHIFERFVTQQP